MADIREIFPILDDGTGAGAALSSAQSGDAASGKIGSVAFAFQDSSGNLALPALSVSGQVPVTLAATGTQVWAQGESTAGSLTVVNVATLTLTAGKDYSDIMILVSSRRDALFQLVWNDNGTPNVIYDVIVGAGQYSFSVCIDNVKFTAGASGTQQLILKAHNFEKASALRGTVAAMESL